jgi:hypothetical protein
MVYLNARRRRRLRLKPLVNCSFPPPVLPSDCFSLKLAISDDTCTLQARICADRVGLYSLLVTMIANQLLRSPYRLLTELDLQKFRRARVVLLP